MGMFRLALAQINPVVGDLEGNVELIRDLIEKVEHCDLAVFGEMSLTGYPLEDLVLKPGFITDNKNYIYHCYFPGGIKEPEVMNQKLLSVDGVKDTGLFINMATKVIIGKENSIEILE